MVILNCSGDCLGICSSHVVSISIELFCFFQALLTETRIIMRFFCMLWSSHCNPERHSLAMTSVLQAKAVKLGHVHLKSLTVEDSSLRYILQKPDPGESRTKQCTMDKVKYVSPHSSMVVQMRVFRAIKSGCCDNCLRSLHRTEQNRWEWNRYSYTSACRT